MTDKQFECIGEDFTYIQGRINTLIRRVTWLAIAVTVLGIEAIIR